MSTAVYYLTALVLAVIIGILVSREPTAPLEPEHQHGIVGYVFDGDTVSLKGSQGRRLRLWGVDAPEKGEKGFSGAKIALERMILNRRISYIEIDRDHYGRIVARIFLPDGREVNRLMINSGAAREYCSYSKGFYGTC